MQLKEPPPTHTTGVEKKYSYPEKIGIGIAISAALLTFPNLLLQTLIYNHNSAKAAWWLPLFNLDQELSLPSIFSVLLFWVCAFLAYCIGLIKKNEQASFFRHWMAIGYIFFFLGFDEGSSIHEKAVNPIKLLAGGELPGFVRFAWVIPALVFVIILAITYLRFFRSLPCRMKLLLMISLTLFLCGVLGMEMIGSHYACNYGIKNLTYNLIVTIEETLEMSGLVIAVYAFLDYMAREYPRITLRLE